MDATLRGEWRYETLAAWDVRNERWETEDEPRVERLGVAIGVDGTALVVEVRALTRAVKGVGAPI